MTKISGRNAILVTVVRTINFWQIRFSVVSVLLPSAPNALSGPMVNFSGRPCCSILGENRCRDWHDAVCVFYYENLYVQSILWRDARARAARGDSAAFQTYYHVFWMLHLLIARASPFHQPVAGASWTKQTAIDPGKRARFRHGPVSELSDAAAARREVCDDCRGVGRRRAR